VLSAVRGWLAIPEGYGARAGRLVMLIFFFSAALALLKAAQSGLFLEVYTRDAIPWAFAVSAVVLATASSLCVSLTPRLGPARLASATLLVAMVVLLALFAVDSLLEIRWLHFLTYVVIEALSGVLVIQVWSAAANATDARTARRLLPVAGIGGSLAWTLSGFLVSPVVHALGAVTLLVFAPVCLGVTWLVLKRIVALDLDARARRGRRRTSLVEAWREGFRFVSREPLMRLVATLALLALLTEQFMDFLLMASAREALEGADAISAFYGRYYGATSLLGLVLLSGVSGRLLSALGATRSLLVTPFAITGAAIVTFLMPGLLAAVILRGTGRVLKQSIWCSAAEQIQTPLSSLRRSQAKAAIRGVLAPGGYAISAVALGLMPADLDTRWLAMLTALSAGAMVLVIATRARRVYRRALHQAIDERRILLGPGRAPAAANLDADACRALGEELVEDDVERAALAAEVLGLSDAKPAGKALARGLAHPAAAVRLAVVRGLERLDPDAAAPLLASRLQDDPDPDVRRAAAEALRATHGEDATHLEALARGEDDDDPRVAAICRIARIERGHDGEALGDALLPLLQEAAALEVAFSALTVSSLRARGVRSQIAFWLEKGEPDAKLLAASAVVRLQLTELLPDVVRLLKDARTAPMAARHLVALDAALDGRPSAGEHTLGASITRLASRMAKTSAPPVAEALVLRLLQHPDDLIRRHATTALGEAIRDGRRRPLAREVVEPLILRQVERAFGLYSILAGLAHDDGVPDWAVEDEFAVLAHEVDLLVETTRRDLLALLLLMGRERLVSAVEVGRRRRTAARDAQMAELLELGLERDLGRAIVPLFERASLRERVAAGRRLGFIDERAVEDPLDAILTLGDAHLRRAALLVYGERFEARYPEQAARDAAMIPLYERMRFLRSVPLFRDLGGDDVLQLAEKVEQVERNAGDAVFSKGDPGEELFLVARGRVAMRVQGEIIAEMGPRDFFGELALLDHAPRSADAVCLEDVELLRLRGADLEELLARRPQAMREIVRVLARRLRASGRGKVSRRTFSGDVTAPQRLQRKEESG